MVCVTPQAERRRRTRVWRISGLRAPTRRGPAPVIPRISRQSPSGSSGRAQTWRSTVAAAVAGNVKAIAGGVCLSWPILARTRHEEAESDVAGERCDHREQDDRCTAHVVFIECLVSEGFRFVAHSSERGPLTQSWMTADQRVPAKVARAATDSPPSATGSRCCNASPLRAARARKRKSQQLAPATRVPDRCRLAPHISASA